MVPPPPRLDHRTRYVGVEISTKSPRELAAPAVEMTPPAVGSARAASPFCVVSTDSSLSNIYESGLGLHSLKPWYADIVNYMVRGEFLPDHTKANREKIRKEARYYVWDDPYLWKHCVDQVIRRCLSDNEVQSVLSFCHSEACGGHFGPNKTARKVLDSGFYWPHIFRDAFAFCKICDRY